MFHLLHNMVFAISMTAQTGLFTESWFALDITTNLGAVNKNKTKQKKKQTADGDFLILI